LLGRSTSWQELWTLLLRRVGTILSAIIPAALLTGIGFFFLVVPGVLLAFFFSFVPTVALFEGVGGTAALRRSYDLVRADWLRMLLVLLAFVVISGVAQFVAGIFLHGVLGTRLLQDALTLVVLPIPVITSVLLYFDIRRKHEGFDQRQLAAELDRFRASA
jgi:ABC-type sugar transport system permease subunit